MGTINEVQREDAAPSVEAIEPAPHPARMPLLDADGMLRGFELLMRPDGVPAEPVETLLDPLAAQREADAAVERMIATLGASDVYVALSGQRGYLNVSRAMLFSDALLRISPERFFIELPPEIGADGDLIARLVTLHAKRYRFVLDHVSQPDQTFAKLLPYAYAIKLDVAKVAPALLPKLAQALKSAGKILIALGVDTPATFEAAKTHGFDLYQGYFFARPHPQSARRSSAPRHALLNLLRLLSAEPSVAQLEAELKLNPVLVMHLMRLANSGEGSIGRKVATLRDAINATGTNRIARWTQLLLYADGRKVRLEDDPLVQLAAARARFMELAATRLAHANRKTVDSAFLTGVFSLVDAVFGESIEITLDALMLSTHIRSAIVKREGMLGTLLSAIEALEHGDWAALDQASNVLGLPWTELAQHAIAAAAWASTADQHGDNAGLERIEE